MSHTGTAERRSIYQPDRGRTGVRDSDSQTITQTHFRIGKDSDALADMMAPAEVAEERECVQNHFTARGGWYDSAPSPFR